MKDKIRNNEGGREMDYSFENTVVEFEGNFTEDAQVRAAAGGMVKLLKEKKEKEEKEDKNDA